MPSVQLSKISHRFGATEVFDALDLEVKDGEYLVLLGASGSGKTTLLRMVAGFTRPETGGVLIAGVDVTKTAPRNRDIAYVPQSDGMYPHLSIQRSIELGLNGRASKSERQSRIEQAARMVGIGELLQRRPDQLSGGQRRRAALAKAIARRASVRLLDEPLSALDAHLRFQIEDDLRSLHQSSPGVTIHVTHDGREAMRLADRIAVIGHGKIAQVDSPERVFEQPCSPAVAAALGTSPFRTLTLRRSAGVWKSQSGAMINGPDAKENTGCEVGYYEDDVRSTTDAGDRDSLSLSDQRSVPKERLRWFLNSLRETV